MAFEQPSFSLGMFPANIDMSTEGTFQFSFVDIGVASGTTGTDGAALVAPISGGVAGLGVLQNNPQLGEAGTVMVQGVSKAKAGGTISIGDILKISDNTGVLIKATTGTYGVAKALEAASSGDTFTVLLKSFGLQ